MSKSSAVRSKRPTSTNANEDQEYCRVTNFKVQFPICPITLEVPTEPVVASDGKVYELSAFRQYKKSMKTQKKTLVSPVTKKPIKQTVYPAVDIKTMIEDAVKHGNALH